MVLHEEVVQLQIDRKEFEIQELRRQLEALEREEPNGTASGVPFGFRASAPSFQPIHPRPTPPVPQPLRQWENEDEDDEVQRCLEIFDADVRRRINEEVDEGIESGKLPEGAEPFLGAAGIDGEDDEGDEEALPNDQEYWEFINQDQAVGIGTSTVAIPIAPVSATPVAVEDTATVGLGRG